MDFTVNQGGQVKGQVVFCIQTKKDLSRKTHVNWPMGYCQKPQ